MSTNKTQNYNLHSWVPEDDFLRSEFNDNFTSLDSTLKTLSDGLTAEIAARETAVATETAARQQAVSDEAKARDAAVTAERTARQNAISGETTARINAVNAEKTAREQAIAALTTGKAEIVCGSYTGNGATERTIALGFQPKAVLLMQNTGRTWVSNSNLDSAYGGLFLPDHPLVCRNQGTGPTWLTAAEIVSTGFKVHGSGLARVNENGNVYHYIAVK